MKPYVFGHRGASGYEIENTIPSFRKGVEMGAGIETDIQMTIDHKLICFHDPIIKVGNEYFYPSKLTYDTIARLKFDDKRKVPQIIEVFQEFMNENHNIRYSFDIANRKVGLELINLAEENNLIDSIEISDRRIGVLSSLRRRSDSVKLLNTNDGSFTRINYQTLDIDKLKDHQISTINVRYKRNIDTLFKDIVDNGFDCYVWGVNKIQNMKQVLKLNYKGKIVDAIYTDYPDKLIELREKLIK
ncbi:MAG: glycerophosphodiester phosphodiesterase [Candidatus Lokiarchaeota archaeon]|nr:glycerophosphodiester phosphodiesterase [Candidatus Lokiarchaeota archaeon]